MATVELERFRLKVREYRLLVNRNQSNLAAYLNLDYNELSNRLNSHKNVRLSHENVRAIVRALAEWGAITTQAQAEELLDLVLCPHFDSVDWHARPLSKLAASTIPPLPVAPAVSPNIPQPDANQKSATNQPGLFDKPTPLNNLPQQLSSFIGRQKEVAYLKNLLIHDKARLLTLVGAGGCGKTRLSLQVASQVIDSFRDGVWFVELAPLSDPTLIPQTIAIALGLSEQPGRPILATLSAYLRSCQLLLVLDNCEHLVDECARLVETLTHTSPELHILATSREGLGITGEVKYLVPSLSLPLLDEVVPPDKVLNFEALHLFVERAKTASPDFRVESIEMGALIKICRRLDGIPLALELAAARTRLLTVEQVQMRLDDRFRLLTGGSRTALPRQQTLRALVDWSYNSLSEQEKQLLNQVSIFAGGWELGAAEYICQGTSLEEYAVLDGLTGLVNKSLVVVNKLDGEIRYSLLETIRQYGLEKLKAGEEEDEVRGHHLDYYLIVSKEWGEKSQTGEQRATLKQMDKEWDNVRAAIEYGLKSGQGDMVIQLINYVSLYFEIRCYYTEGRRYLEQGLVLPNTSEVNRALAFNMIGFSAYRQGDLQAAQSYYEESLAIALKTNDNELHVYILSALGLMQFVKGEYVQSRNNQEKALSMVEGMNDLMKASVLANRGLVVMAQGEYERAQRIMEESDELSRKIGNKWAIITNRNSQIQLALILEDYPIAYRYVQEALVISEEIGFLMGKFIALALKGMVLNNENKYEEACLAFEECLTMSLKGGMRTELLIFLSGVSGLLGRIWLNDKLAGLPERIALLCGAFSALSAETGIVMPQPLKKYYENGLEVAHSGLAEPVFEEMFSRGQAMSNEEIIVYTRQILAGI